MPPVDNMTNAQCYGNHRSAADSPSTEGQPPLNCAAIHRRYITAIGAQWSPKGALGGSIIT